MRGTPGFLSMSQSSTVSALTKLSTEGLSFSGCIAFRKDSAGQCYPRAHLPTGWREICQTLMGTIFPPTPCSGRCWGGRAMHLVGGL